MITITDIRKSFSKPAHLTAVDDVTFSCQPGRVFALLGPNGSGKTTTLRMIASLLSPDAGQIEVCGFDTRKDTAKAKSKLGFLTGSTALYDRLTPRETIHYFGKLHGMSPKALKERENELVEHLEIGDFLHRRVGKLSTGMKQKVSIARALIHDPEVLIFDEATSGLDVIAARSIVKLIRAYRDAGKTILFSTHLMGEVDMLGDDIGILHHGKLIHLSDYQSFKAGMRSESLEDEFLCRLDAAETKPRAEIVQ